MEIPPVFPGTIVGAWKQGAEAKLKSPAVVVVGASPLKNLPPVATQ
jgi:hypothetical protein